VVPVSYHEKISVGRSEIIIVSRYLKYESARNYFSHWGGGGGGGGWGGGGGGGGGEVMCYDLIWACTLRYVAFFSFAASVVVGLYGQLC
jgi:hypothetical protein